MIRELTAAAVLVTAASSVAHATGVPGAFPPRIVETFDDYPDGLELWTIYPTVNNTMANTATVTSSDVLYPGIQGKAAEFDSVTTTNGTVHRIQNDELALLTPDLFGPLVFRADIFDDGLTEFKRATVNIRFQMPGGGAQNVIQMGLRPASGVFGHMQSALAFNPEPGWRPFNLPEEMNEPAEIGAGWHRFAVHITMTDLIYSLDLHRDGTIDAVDIVPAILHPIGFNEMRIAKMFSPEFSAIAFDNLLLSAIPEPASAFVFMMGIAGYVGLFHRPLLVRRDETFRRY